VEVKFQKNGVWTELNSLRAEGSVRKIARGKKVKPVVWDETDGVTAAVATLAITSNDDDEEDYDFKFCETLTEKNLFNYFKEDKDSIMDDTDFEQGVRGSVTQFRVALDTFAITHLDEDEDGDALYPDFTPTFDATRLYQECRALFL
jgi:hypothetical protein